jgi:PBP1b-binding outer membrane lipoprotein LpoB
MIKNKLIILILLQIVILTGCVQTNNNPKKTGRISDYTKSTESFKIDTGLVHFDTIPKNLTTHQLDSGTNLVFVYERTGVTMIDANDWEAKYTETLIFQLDSAVGEFEYCDTNLKQIDCKYYWICLAKEIKKEIIDVEKGSIKGYITNDSIMIDIDVNSKFGFGGLMEKDNDRKIKYKTTRR